MEQDTLRLAEQALIDAALKLEEEWRSEPGPIYAAGLIAAVVERASYLRGVRKAHAEREAQS